MSAAAKRERKLCAASGFKASILARKRNIFFRKKNFNHCQSLNMRNGGNSHPDQTIHTLARPREEEETHSYGRRNIQIDEASVLFSVSFALSFCFGSTYARRERLDSVRNERNERRKGTDG